MSSRDAAVALLDGLHQQGITLGLRGNRLAFAPPALYKTLTPETLAGIREHREALKTLIREGYRPQAAPVASGQPQGGQASPLPAPLVAAPAAASTLAGVRVTVPPPAPASRLGQPCDPAFNRRVVKAAEPEPEVYAFHYRVTDRDVRRAMQAMGDEMLHAYVVGRLPRAQAYEMTRLGLMHVMEMPS